MARGRYNKELIARFFQRMGSEPGQAPRLLVFCTFIDFYKALRATALEGPSSLERRLRRLGTCTNHNSELRTCFEQELNPFVASSL